MRVTLNHDTAMYKLLRYCGIRYSDILNLEQSDFNLNKKMIKVVSRKTNKTRYATIRPFDIDFFKLWFKTFKGKLFPFSLLQMRLHMKKFGGTHALRKELANELQNMNWDDNLIRIKLGLFIEDPDNEIDKTALFKKIQELESQSFGDVVRQ